MTNMFNILFLSYIITLFSMLHISSAFRDNFCLSELPSVELTPCLPTPSLSPAKLPFSASEIFSWGFNLQNTVRRESSHCGASRKHLISTGLWYLRISRYLRMPFREVSMDLTCIFKHQIWKTKSVNFNWDFFFSFRGIVLINSNYYWCHQG